MSSPAAQADATDHDDRQRRLLAYENATAWWMVGLAALFLVVYALPILVVELPNWARALCNGISLVVWVVFAVDLAIRLWLAPRRLRYLAAHWLDLLAVVLPMFRGLRVLRVFAAGEWLVMRGARFAVGQTMFAVVAGAALVAFVGALAVLDAERGTRGASIHNFGTALWWAAETMSTVGYGDYVPVTVSGRVVAVMMMVVGISLLGIVTATVAAWFLQQIRGAQREEEDLVLTELRELRAEIAGLRADRDGTLTTGGSASAERGGS